MYWSKLFIKNIKSVKNKVIIKKEPSISEIYKYKKEQKLKYIILNIWNSNLIKIKARCEKDGPMRSKLKIQSIPSNLTLTLNESKAQVVSIRA